MVADAAGLGGAARGVGLRVEVEDDGPAGEVGERDGLAVLVGQREVGGALALGDHLSNLESRRSLRTRPSVWHCGQ